MPSSQIILSIVGARPQFVKLAPICRAFEYEDLFEHIVVHTGQHYDSKMSESFFEQLRMPDPDENLSVGSGSHAEQTGAMLTGIEELLQRYKPAAVISYGDTNSTLAATLAAAKQHVPIVHVEAGLRSFDRSMPEEINRIVADHCSDRLYAPTPNAMENLSNENLGDRAFHSGDVMLDAVIQNLEFAKASEFSPQSFGLQRKDFGLVTIHRAANTTELALKKLLEILVEVSQAVTSLFFPVHPRSRAVLDKLGFVPPENVMLSEPLTYLDSIALIDAAAVVITDSGGVQKEAAFLGTPCVTLRDETEWVETVEIGANKLAGSDPEKLVQVLESFVDRDGEFAEKHRSAIETYFGSGDAASTILRDLKNWIAEK